MVQNLLHNLWRERVSTRDAVTALEVPGEAVSIQAITQDRECLAARVRGRTARVMRAAA